MRISDWSSDVGSSDLADFSHNTGVLHDLDQVDTYRHFLDEGLARRLPMICANPDLIVMRGEAMEICAGALALDYEQKGGDVRWHGKPHPEVYRSRSEEHTSELQSLMRISYAVFCLKKTK